jgi:hypothetical protein
MRPISAKNHETMFGDGEAGVLERTPNLLAVSLDEPVAELISVVAEALCDLFETPRIAWHLVHLKKKSQGYLIRLQILK